MAEFLEAIDLAPFATIETAKAEAMIEDATAMALLAAPCLDDGTLTPGQVGALKAILRGAILRWHDSGSGALASETIGPFGQTYDTRQQRRGMFWPSEIAQLRDLCGGTAAGGAFGIDTTPAGYRPVHADICSLNFGGTYCSCGAILTGDLPLWEA